MQFLSLSLKSISLASLLLVGAPLASANTLVCKVYEGPVKWDEIGKNVGMCASVTKEDKAQVIYDSALASYVFTYSGPKAYEVSKNASIQLWVKSKRGHGTNNNLSYGFAASAYLFPEVEGRQDNILVECFLREDSHPDVTVCQKQ